MKLLFSTEMNDIRCQVVMRFVTEALSVLPSFYGSFIDNMNSLLVPYQMIYKPLTTVAYAQRQGEASTTSHSKAGIYKNKLDRIMCTPGW